MNINKLHNMLGHCGEETTRKTAAFYGWLLTGKFEVCDHCITAKAKQASIAKTTNTKSDKTGERLSIGTVTYTHLRAHENKAKLVYRMPHETKKKPHIIHNPHSPPNYL